jgi:hypothetical protein
MAGYLPSAQARKGKKNLNDARNLRDEWKDIIPNGDLIALQNRITMCVISPQWFGIQLIIILVMRATEMGVGLDSKRGLRKVSHARAYRKYAEETLHIAMVSIPSSESPQETTYLTFARRSLNEPGILTSKLDRTKHTTTRSNLHAPSLQQRPPIDLTSATRTCSQLLSRAPAG